MFYQYGWLLPGDIVEFNGRVDTYQKGYYKDKTDYRLTYPSNVSIIRNGVKLEKSTVLLHKKPYEIANKIAQI